MNKDFLPGHSKLLACVKISQRCDEFLLENDSLMLTFCCWLSVEYKQSREKFSQKQAASWCKHFPAPKWKIRWRSLRKFTILNCSMHFFSGEVSFPLNFKANKIDWKCVPMIMLFRYSHSSLFMNWSRYLSIYKLPIYTIRAMLNISHVFVGWHSRT